MTKIDVSDETQGVAIALSAVAHVLVANGFATWAGLANMLVTLSAGPDVTPGAAIMLRGMARGWADIPGQKDDPRLAGPMAGQA